MISVLASIKLHEGQRAKFLEIFNANVPKVRQESGCIDYKLHQDNDDPAVFIFYETWESQAYLEKHMNSAHFKSYVSAVDGLLEEKLVHLMTLSG